VEKVIYYMGLSILYGFLKVDKLFDTTGFNAFYFINYSLGIKKGGVNSVLKVLPHVNTKHPNVFVQGNYLKEGGIEIGKFPRTEDW